MSNVHDNTSINADLRVIGGGTYDFNDPIDCSRLIDRYVYDQVNDQISRYCRYVGPRALRDGKITFQEYVQRGETDPSQHTQAMTKFLQYFFMDAILELIEMHQIPLGRGLSSGCDFIHTPTGKPVEFKSSGNKDGAIACLGNLGVNGKADFTLVCRYAVRNNAISERQTLVILDSGRKWREYNPVKFDKNGKTSNSNFSKMRARPSDDEDVFVLSGYRKLNSEWIKFIKEKI